MNKVTFEVKIKIVRIGRHRLQNKTISKIYTKV